MEFALTMDPIELRTAKQQPDPALAKQWVATVKGHISTVLHPAIYISAPHSVTCFPAWLVFPQKAKNAVEMHHWLQREERLQLKRFSSCQLFFFCPDSILFSPLSDLTDSQQVLVPDNRISFRTMNVLRMNIAYSDSLNI